MVPDMNTLHYLGSVGDINSTNTNDVELNGSRGRMLLRIGAIDEGETYGWLVIINFPKIKPRIAVAKEDRNVKAGN